MLLTLLSSVTLQGLSHCCAVSIHRCELRSGLQRSRSCSSQALCATTSRTPAPVQPLPRHSLYRALRGGARAPEDLHGCVPKHTQRSVSSVTRRPHLGPDASHHDAAGPGSGSAPAWPGAANAQSGHGAGPGPWPARQQLAQPLGGSAGGRSLGSNGGAAAAERAMPGGAQAGQPPAWRGQPPPAAFGPAGGPAPVASHQARLAHVRDLAGLVLTECRLAAGGPSFCL